MLSFDTHNKNDNGNVFQPNKYLQSQNNFNRMFGVHACQKASYWTGVHEKMEYIDAVPSFFVVVTEYLFQYFSNKIANFFLKSLVSKMGKNKNLLVVVVVGLKAPNDMNSCTKKVDNYLECASKTVQIFQD